MSILRKAALAISAAAIPLTFVLPGAATADPTPAACAAGHACASSPTCPADAVQLPSGPHADRSEPAPQNCITITITPKPSIVQTAPRS